MNRNSAYFLAKFAVVMIVLYGIIAVRPVNDSVVEPFTAFLATLTANVVVMAGQPAEQFDTVIKTPTHAVDIKNGCNGLEAIILIVAAMIAFPATAGARILGVVGGFLFVQAFNVFRLAALVWIGEHHRDLFELFHVAIMQTLVILVSIAFFVYWSRRFATRPAEDNR